jgi:hypothetical protein
MRCREVNLLFFTVEFEHGTGASRSADRPPSRAMKNESAGVLRERDVGLLSVLDYGLRERLNGVTRY